MSALYECSVCSAAVCVVPQGPGLEPEKLFSCGHADAVIWANRTVVLRGAGHVAAGPGVVRRFAISLRQLLQVLAGRVS
jgi:hypothetical protein